MIFWYLSHRWPAKAQVRLSFRAVSPEPLLFAHMKYGSRRRVQPKIRHLAPLDGCAFAIKRVSLRRTKSAIISWAASVILQLSNTILSVPLVSRFFRIVLVTRQPPWPCGLEALGRALLYPCGSKPNLDYCKNLKISDTQKVAVITVKVEQDGFSLE